MKSTGIWLLILLFCISLLGGCSENEQGITSGSSGVPSTQSEPGSSSDLAQTDGGSLPSTVEREELSEQQEVPVVYMTTDISSEGLVPAYSIDGTSIRWDRSANGYRLPTEAEWEYACRAGTNTPFYTETSISAEESNYWGDCFYMIENHYFDQGDWKQSLVFIARPGLTCSRSN